VIPKPVLVSAGDSPDSITSRYFTPHKCHASHAVTGAIGVATAFALPGTVASGGEVPSGVRTLSVLHPQGRIDVAVEIEGCGEQAAIRRAALVRTARKIFQGQLHIPDYVFSKPPTSPPRRRHEAPEDRPHRLAAAWPWPPPPTPPSPAKPSPRRATAAGGGNDAMARTIAQKLGPLLGQTIIIDNRAGANGSIASEYVARARRTATR
jgi:hypothetical protein